MKNWYVLFTGYENTLVTMKRLVKSCLPKGCGTYVPVTIKGSTDRPNRLYHQSVYPFYIFVCCTDPSQLDILLKKMRELKIDGYFLTNERGEKATLSSDEVRKITTQKDTPDKPVTKLNGFSLGDKIRIKYGPFLGYESNISVLTPEFAFIPITTKKKKRCIDLPVFYSDLEKL